MQTPSEFLPVIDSIPFLTVENTVFLKRLGGLTNINYLISVDDVKYVVRVPGEGTSEYIDRDNEHFAANLFSAAGVNVGLLFFNTQGVMVTKYVEGAITMNSSLFKDVNCIYRASMALRAMHSVSGTLKNDFKLFDMIDSYKSLLASKNAELPEGYDVIQRDTDSIRELLLECDIPMVPCHCDPLCENFLDTGDKMYIIDYEYAGNNDPMWDLGDLSVEGKFDETQDIALVSAYFNTTSPPEIPYARMVIYKALCDLLWTLWGVIQHVNGNAAEDFWAYAISRFQRCEKLIRSELFTQQMSVLRSSVTKE